MALKNNVASTVTKYEFGLQIKKICSNKQITQQELANRMTSLSGKNVPKQSVNRIIKGQSNLTIETMQLVAIALDSNLNIKLL